MSSHSASSSLRSRVMPGRSSTIACWLPTMRLNSVLLPTFGRPMMTTVASSRSGRCRRRSCRRSARWRSWLFRSGVEPMVAPGQLRRAMPSVSMISTTGEGRRAWCRRGSVPRRTGRRRAAGSDGPAARRRACGATSSPVMQAGDAGVAAEEVVAHRDHPDVVASERLDERGEHRRAELAGEDADRSRRGGAATRSPTRRQPRRCPHADAAAQSGVGRRVRRGVDGSEEAAPHAGGLVGTTVELGSNVRAMPMPSSCIGKPS